MQYDDFQIESFLKTGEHEQELRAGLGDTLYDELARLAHAIEQTPATLEAHRRKVIILPGLMGSRLSAIEDGQSDLIWIQPIDLAKGGISRLKWGAPVAATGTILAPYLRMRLSLTLAGYDAEFIPFDWRQSPGVTGSKLLSQIKARGLSDVTLVCHSMGGLVARQMAEEDPNCDVISSVVTIGTPNRGSYAPVQVFDLSHSLLGPLGLVDLKHDRKTLVEKYLRAFPGLIEMMPSPDARPSETYFTKTAWPKSAVPPTPTSLKKAKTAAAALATPDHRFYQIIGTGEQTVVGAHKEGDAHIYTLSSDGDGTVPRDLAEMGDGVARYYCEGGHGWLCNMGDVIAATVDLIAVGTTVALPRIPTIATNEAVALEVISTELAAANEGALSPKQLTDYAGSFLSIQMGGKVASAADTHLEAENEGMAYSAQVVQDASRRWQASGEERDMVSDTTRDARPLQAETPRRLDAYARRLLSQVEAANGNSHARKISNELETALGFLEGLEGSQPLPIALDSARFERIIGEAEEFLSVMFIKRAVVASRAVGRIVSASTGRGFGTGFLIAPGILMTNHHVLHEARAAQGAAVQFSYELEIDSREMPGHTFTLAPDLLFYSDVQLDMAIVAVSPVAEDGTALSDFGFLPLVGVEGKIRKGQPVNIIQHPLAGRKQVVFRESTLTALPKDADYVAHYTGDTQPGSSGSPVFSDRWEVVALHHSGVPDTAADGSYINVDGGVWNAVADPQMKTVKWVANEGIRVSRIVAHLRTVPDRLTKANLPGAPLVLDLLGVSREAAIKGLFVKTQLVPPVAPETNSELPRDVASSESAALTIPLHINFEIGDSRASLRRSP